MSESNIGQRLTIVHADLSKHRLGLGDDTYMELLTSVNVVFHLAWTVNFNLALSSFETY